MAIERTMEFALNLGEIVSSRLSSFDLVRKNIQARQETELQRMIVDDNLTEQQQLDYRKNQLEKEKDKTFPDNNFIENIKSSISSLKEAVKQRQYRDAYFSLLEDLTSGKKTLENHLSFLQDEYSNGGFDQSLKDEIQSKILDVKGQIITRDKNIVDSQITFYQNDGTKNSVNKAIDLVSSQLLKQETMSNPDIKQSYELQLQSLNKKLREVEVEDKAVWFSTQLATSDKNNPSIWKVETLAGFKDTADTGNPVNIGGVRYDSEKAYWESTLNNYVQSNFASEYTAENTNLAKSFYTKTGSLPDSYLSDLVKKNNSLSSIPELTNFSQTILSATQASISALLDLKVKDLSSKYYLNNPDLATQSDYTKAMDELKNLQTLFPNEYSLSPAIKSIETSLVAKKYETTQDILQAAQNLVDTGKVKTLEEGIKKAGTISDVEIPTSEYLAKTPTEVAQKVATDTALIPQQKQQLTDLNAQIKTVQEEITKQQEKQLADLNAQIKSTQEAIAKEQQKKTEVETSQNVTPTVPTTTKPVAQPEAVKQPVVQPTSTYAGVSIVDYLKSVNQDSSFSSRSKLAQEKGIQNYTGTPEQNTKLLKILRGF